MHAIALFSRQLAYAALAATLPLQSACAQPVAQRHALPAPSARYADSAATVPFELFRGNRIFLSGTINGQPASMLLDSGAGSTVIDRAFARRIGLAEGQPIPVRGAGGTVQGALLTGIAVSAGAMTLTGATVVALDMGDIAAAIGRPIDVVLGLEAFRAGIVDIDFAARRIRFAPAAGFTAPAGAAQVTIDRDHGIGLMPVSINGGAPVQAQIDLGHGGSLIVSRAVWEADSSIGALPWAPTTRGGVGGRVPKRQVTLPSVTVAGQRFEAVPATLNEGANDIPVRGANIGLDLLQRFRLVFDYGHDRLYMTPVAGAAQAPLPKDRVGMRVELAGDRLRVEEVTPSSPAAAAGWRVGDEIISVDGAPVGPRYYDTPQAQWTTMAAGRRLDLVRADGRSLPVTLRDFF